MDEKRRIEEMQMQLKIKELELDFVREKLLLFEKWLTSKRSNYTF
jgi:hypothetical protein